MTKKKTVKEVRKVYCNHCKNLKNGEIQGQAIFDCFAIGNLGSWFSSEMPKMPPHIKNENNNCKDFEGREGTTEFFPVIGPEAKKMDLTEKTTMPAENFNLNN